MKDNKPKKYMLGTVLLTQWNNGDNSDTFTIVKRYKDKETNEWTEGKSLYRDDLLKLKILIDKALESDIKEF